MARKSLTGQLNMFDFFKSLEDSPMGEVQMVSLMPDEFPEEETEAVQVQKPRKARKAKSVQEVIIQETPIQEEIRKAEEVEEVEEAPVIKNIVHVDVTNDRPVMSRQYEIEGRQIEIAYINYNKVRICRSGEEPEIREFASSKEAVDYYVQKMQELEPEE